MDKLIQYLPLIIPLLVIELILMAAALFDLVRRPKTRGPKWVWVLIIVLVNTIGPIVYFVMGREED